MTDYFGNQTPSNPYPNQPQSNPYGTPQQQNPYGNQQQDPYSNQYANPQSNPFPATSYPQSPPTGMPQPSFPSYYTSGQPALTPQPPKPKNTTRILLIVAAVLMFAGTGVFAGLYVASNSDHDTANSVLDDRKAELADVKKNITSAEDDKSTAEQHNTDLESQNSALQACIDATEHFIWELPGDAPDADVSAAIQAMRNNCI